MIAPCSKMPSPGCCSDSLQCHHAESLSSIFASMCLLQSSSHASPDLDEDVRQFVEALPLSELSRLLDPGLTWHSGEDLCSHAVALQASLARRPDVWSLGLLRCMWRLSRCAAAPGGLQVRGRGARGSAGQCCADLMCKLLGCNPALSIRRWSWPFSLCGRK